MKEVKANIIATARPGVNTVCGAKELSGKAPKPFASTTPPSNTASTRISAAISAPRIFDDRSIER